MTDKPRPAPDPDLADRRFTSHARLVMALTLVSRVSGLARDAVCSRVFGASWVWSAFVTAFIVPNLFRRLFGEGALSAAFIPLYTRLSRDDPRAAGALASLTVAALIAALGAITLIAELALLAVLSARGGSDANADLVIVLAMIMLPFAPLVCLGAILGGMLQTKGRFAPHAGAPVVLNLCMASAAAAGGLALGLPPQRVAVLVASGVMLAGILQTAWFLLALRSTAGWTRELQPARAHFRTMLATLVPALIGMGALQLGTAIDGVLAGWPVLVGPRTPWGSAYPMDESAASVLFFAARLYQFPLGVFGIAIATAVFPALSRAWGETGRFAATLDRGVRTSLFIALPATVGLMIVAEPMAMAIYAGGEFGESDGARVAAALRAYAPAIWAYSLTHVLTRAFYAAGNTRLPMVVGIGAVGLNLTLDVTLMWPLAERGLAWGTSIAAIAQTLVLCLLVRRRLLPGAPVASAVRSALVSLAAALAMGAGVIAAGRLAPVGIDGWWGFAASLGRDVVVGTIVYGGVSLALRRPELGWLLRRDPRDGETEVP